MKRSLYQLALLLSIALVSCQKEYIEESENYNVGLTDVSNILANDEKLINVRMVNDELVILGNKSIYKVPKNGSLTKFADWKSNFTETYPSSSIGKNYVVWHRLNQIEIRSLKDPNLYMVLDSSDLPFLGYDESTHAHEVFMTDLDRLYLSRGLSYMGAIPDSAYRAWQIDATSGSIALTDILELNLPIYSYGQGRYLMFYYWGTNNRLFGVYDSNTEKVIPFGDFFVTAEQMDISEDGNDINFAMYSQSGTILCQVKDGLMDTSIRLSGSLYGRYSMQFPGAVKVYEDYIIYVNNYRDGGVQIRNLKNDKFGFVNSTLDPEEITNLAVFNDKLWIITYDKIYTKNIDDVIKDAEVK